MQVTSSSGFTSGRDWVYEELTANKMFNHVTYDPNLQISWSLAQIAGPSQTTTVGTTSNPTYVTFQAVQRNNADPNLNAPAGWKMLRTFADIGCKAGMADVAMSKDGVSLAVLGAFSLLDIATWDSKPMVYYKTWDFKGANPAFTSSAGLIKGLDGDCTSFARLLIDVLRAQGIENNDDVYAMQAKKDQVNLVGADPTMAWSEDRWMFIKQWQAVPRGSQILAGYKWTDASNNVPPWGLIPGAGPNSYQYTWSPAYNEVTKIKDQIASQNNDNPQAIFMLHIIDKLQIGGKDYYYDPSYGESYSGMQDFDNRAVGFYAVAIGPQALAGGVIYNVVMAIEQNPGNVLQRIMEQGALQLHDY